MIFITIMMSLDSNIIRWNGDDKTPFQLLVENYIVIMIIILLKPGQLQYTNAMVNGGD